eukprot:TRINITY_DN13387_c0_g1_i2.p1 TRINITY_DN13387_c0_g1~~TRINITY_DN13387_c0_g1_i2.p1  ORF type:complete len:328 (+),score=102.11 TRINITY_DN13387_c0_g1_i2:44-985(+)
MAMYVDQQPLPGWEDVTPIPQAECENPVARIAYASDYETAMDYFRAAQASGELSERALELTADIIDMNSAHYTAWQYRRRCLFALNKDLAEELSYVRDVALSNPKNYQIWYHRRAVVEQLGDASTEIPFVDEVLQLDAKNYHAWAHRQWALKTYGGWEGELEETEALLTADLRNNSAWNHRWFVIHNAGVAVTEEVVAAEAEFALRHIERAVHNESAWNYLRGYLVDGASFDRHPQVKAHCQKLLAEHSGAADCTHLHHLLAEAHEQEGTEESLNTAIELLQKLRNDIDPVREKYWDRRIARATAKLERLVCA